MKFAKEVTIAPSMTFKVNPDVKKYTLRDNGFELTKAGNYEFSRSLDEGNPFNPKVIVNILVSGTLDQLKMSITSADGMHDVNIFKNDMEQYVNEFQFIIENLINSGILIK